MMRNVNLLLILIVFVSASFSGLYSQDCNAYFPYKAGISIGMSHFDKKEKLTGTSVQTVKAVNKIQDGVSFSLSQLHKDEKGKELFSGDFDITCQAGLIKVDMRKLLGPAMMGAYEGMEVQVEGDALEFPSVLKLGQVLKGGAMQVNVLNQGMKMMSIEINVSDRKVEALEKIITPAGTYMCYKIACETETKLFMKVKAKSEEWIAEGVGVVKTASYNANGKLESYSLLTSISK